MLGEVRRSLICFGPQSNIEKITNTNNVSDVLRDQMSRKKRGNPFKNYSPPIPPTRIPFLLIPEFFYARFFEFSVFQFFGLLDPYWTPIGPLDVGLGQDGGFKNWDPI